jgi:hypothetical protein
MTTSNPLPKLVGISADDTLSGLNTTDKSSIVNALNEVLENSGNAGGVDYSTYTFTATSDNTTSFTIPSASYSPTTDKLQLYYNGDLLTLNENYSLSSSTVTLGWGLNNSEEIFVVIFKNASSGSVIGNLSNLTTIAKDTLVNSINEVNSKANNIGDLTTLTTTKKDTIVNSINEVDTSVVENTKHLSTSEVNLDYYIFLVSNGDWLPAFTQAISDLVDGGTLIVNATDHPTSPITSNKAIKIKGSTGYSYTNKSLISALGNQTHILKFGNVSNANCISPQIENIFINGNSKTISDAALIFEKCNAVINDKLHIGYVNGRAIRGRIFWDSRFMNTFIRECGVDSDAVVYFDSIYNSDSNNNCNNITFDNCHFEHNIGAYFKSASDSNLDILRITNSKFEHGGKLNGGNTTVQALFNFLNASRLKIQGNTFTNFGSTGYDDYNEILSITNGKLNIYKDNEFVNVTGNALHMYASCQYVICKDNQSDTYLAVKNESNYPQNFEMPRYTQFPQGWNNNSKYDLFRSIHEVAWNSPNFIVDTNAQNQQGTVYQVTGTYQRIAEFGSYNLNSLRGFPNDIKLKIRAKSSVGTGKIYIQLNGSTNLSSVILGTTYQYADFTITTTQLASISKIDISSENSTDSIQVDGFYVVPLTTST